MFQILFGKYVGRQVEYFRPRAVHGAYVNFKKYINMFSYNCNNNSWCVREFDNYNVNYMEGLSFSRFFVHLNIDKAAKTDIKQRKV